MIADTIWIITSSDPCVSVLAAAETASKREISRDNEERAQQISL
jgi:hypothetical protein